MHAVLVRLDRNRDFPPAEPPVSGCRIASRNARHLERNHLAAEQRYQPADRPDEARTALAGPIHRLRPRDAEDQSGQRLGEDVGGSAAGPLLLEGVVLALRRRGDPQLFHRHAHLAREAMSGAFARLLRRSAHRFPAVFLALGQPIGEQHQPPRRRIDARHRAFQAVLFEDLPEALFEMRQRPADHPVGDLLSSDFEQKWQRHYAATSALCWSSQICAVPTASRRTRAMTPTRSVTEIAPRESSRLNRCEHFRTRS